MEFAAEKAAAFRIIDGIENGMVPVPAIARLLEESDSALVYLIFAWLRAKYGADHPAAQGVIGRVVELSSNHTAVERKAKEGKKDSIAQWFEETQNYRDYTSRSFVEFVVDKLEG